jgi:uncharacterized oxidoreductase
VNNLPTISAPNLTAFATQLFEAAGVPTFDSMTVAESLVGANLRGHDSHGVMRIAQYIGFLEQGHYQIGVSLVVERETPAVITCDAQWGLGQIQARRLLEMLIPKATALGVAAGTLRHCGHIGRLGEYAERAADSGIILIATVNNDGGGQRVAPPGGVEPRLGTNPLCIAVPTTQPKEPIVLDFGTSVVAEGKVRVHHISKLATPDGWLMDSQGRPTNDPAVLYTHPSGSILPMGGQQAYKGFGLALLLDLLAGGLSGGRSCHAGAFPSRGNNVVFIAFDPAHFVSTGAFIDNASDLADYVRTTARAPGVESILLPGDPERITMTSRTQDGIPVDHNHWQILAGLAERLNVPLPEISETGNAANR